MIKSAFDLPIDIFEDILNVIPRREHQDTVWALMKANPRAPIHHSRLFQSICIRQPRQAVLLYQRLRRRTPALTNGEEDNSSTPISWIRDVFINCWTVDADVIINLLHLLPELRTLNIWIGPHNFAPEHLDELFAKPIRGLDDLSIRFRPYVQKANYFQFLKGAYFDSLLVELAKWPAEDCPPVLSIVQDSFTGQTTQNFAQPIVFFRLDSCLSVLLHSVGWSSSLTAFRLQIPARSIIRSICGTPLSASSQDFQTKTLPPDLEFLDLSTSIVLDNEVDTLLAHFPNLRHLVLDGCPILRGEVREGDWNALGKRCALVGSRRAKDREKTLRGWTEARSRTLHLDGAPAPGQGRERRPKRGRKGLSTASLSIRESRPSPSTPGPNPSVVQSSASVDPALRVRVIPSQPTLRSISITLATPIKPDKLSTIRNEFEAGWSEGIALLGVTRARLKTSAQHCLVRAMRFTSTKEDHGSEAFDDGLEGLEDVDPDDERDFGLSGDGSGMALSVLDAPVLCFAGSNESLGHPTGCGHSVGKQLMRDDN